MEGTFDWHDQSSMQMILWMDVLMVLWKALLSADQFSIPKALLDGCFDGTLEGTFPGRSVFNPDGTLDGCFDGTMEGTFPG